MIYIKAKANCPHVSLELRLTPPSDGWSACLKHLYAVICQECPTAHCFANSITCCRRCGRGSCYSVVSVATDETFVVKASYCMFYCFHSSTSSIQFHCCWSQQKAVTDQQGRQEQWNTQGLLTFSRWSCESTVRFHPALNPINSARLLAMSLYTLQLHKLKWILGVGHWTWCCLWVCLIEHNAIAQLAHCHWM